MSPGIASKSSIVNHYESFDHATQANNRALDHSSLQNNAMREQRSISAMGYQESQPATQKSVLNLIKSHQNLRNQFVDKPKVFAHIERRHFYDGRPLAYDSTTFGGPSL